MKPPPFDYVRPTTAEEVVAALADGDTHVLAGGQSLVLEMNYRTARPARLVDINRVAAFTGVTVEAGSAGSAGYASANPAPAGAGALRVRPLVRHATFADGVDAGGLGRLLRRVAHHIAHPPIRTRGTMLGSLAYAHPAAEWPAVAVTLDADLELAGPDGPRTVAAADFFTGPFTTARRSEELLSQARLPLTPPRAGVGFVEHRRTHASFAQLAAIAVLELDGASVRYVRLGLVNAADRPTRARWAEEVLLGQPAGEEAFAEAAHAAAQRDADPRPQPYADPAYQRHVVAVLVRRALSQAYAEIAPNGG